MTPYQSAGDSFRSETNEFIFVLEIADDQKYAFLLDDVRLTKGALPGIIYGKTEHHFRKDCVLILLSLSCCLFDKTATRAFCQHIASYVMQRILLVIEKHTRRG